MTSKKSHDIAIRQSLDIGRASSAVVSILQRDHWKLRAMMKLRCMIERFDGSSLKGVCGVGVSGFAVDQSPHTLALHTSVVSGVYSTDLYGMKVDENSGFVGRARTRLRG
jgi:hypothetical protein